MTSGLLLVRADSTAALKASWVFSVQRLGSSAMGLQDKGSERKVDNGIVNFGGDADGPRTAPPTAAPAPGRSGAVARRPRPAPGPHRRASFSSACSLRFSASSSRTRCTPARLRPSVGELLDAAQQRDVVVAVAAAAPAGAGGIDQAPALVDPQRLGVHAGQLGGDRDDVHGIVSSDDEVVSLLLRAALVRRRGGLAATRRWRLRAPRPPCVRRRQLGRHRHLDGDEQVAGALARSPRLDP